MLKQNQQPPFPSQPLPQSPFEQQLQDTPLSENRQAPNYKSTVPKVHLLGSSNFSHFPRKTRLQLGIKFPDQHPKPDLKHNTTKTRPKVLQNTEKMHRRPTPHGVGCGGRNPSSCTDRLSCGRASFPSHWSPESFHCLSC